MQRSPFSSLKEREGRKWGFLQQELVSQVDLSLFFIAEMPIIMDLVMVQNKSRPIPRAWICAGTPGNSHGAEWLRSLFEPVSLKDYSEMTMLWLYHWDRTIWEHWLATSKKANKGRARFWLDVCFQRYQLSLISPLKNSEICSQAQEGGRAGHWALLEKLN